MKIVLQSQIETCPLNTPNVLHRTVNSRMDQRGCQAGWVLRPPVVLTRVSPDPSARMT